MRDWSAAPERGNGRIRGREMIEIYRAGSQLTKVKLMIAFAALCAAAALYFGWQLFNSYGTAPGDGGVLAPVGERIAWALGVVLLGLAFLAGMWLYGRLYATSIGYDEAADALHVRTLEFLASREQVYPASAVQGARYQEGRLETIRHSVDAPWFKLRIEGRSWPIIVDAQGEFLEPELAARLLRTSGG